jgi:pimeloyl-ACP methyl ester carboxylesterase
VEKRVFETSLGETWLWGRPEAWASRGRAIVILTGAFAHANAMRVMAELIPDIPVLVGDIPGNNCPRLADQTVAAYREAYTATLAALDRPLTLCGNSLGGTVALGVRAETVQTLLLLEPVTHSLSAAPLWPGFRRALAERPDDADLREILWKVFGVDETAAEARDYVDALEGLAVPTTVLAGVAVGKVPSLLTLADRAELSAHPRVRLRTVVNVGHDIGAGATSVIVAQLREASGLPPVSPAAAR